MDGLEYRTRSPRTGELVVEQTYIERDAVSDQSFTFVASSNAVDRYGDVIEQDWILDDYWKNPVLLVAHQTRALPVGRVTSFNVTPDRSRTLAEIAFVPDDLANEDTKYLATLVRHKFLNAVSVGFIPGEETDRRDPATGAWLGYVYRKNKLVELSLVTVPANQDAVQVQLEARALGLSEERLRNLLSPDRKPAASGLSASRRRALQADIELLRLRSRDFDRRHGHAS
jgi:HK97 family phage prohead protease